MAVKSSQERQDDYTIAVLPDECTTKCGSQLAFLSVIEVPELSKNHPCLDTPTKRKNHINLEMENIVSYIPCAVDIDIENGKTEAPKANEETVGNLKNEDPLTKTLQRQISIQIGGKFMQLLVNQCLMLPKFTCKDKSAADRVHEVPNNRSRKYKRSASFNSRKVVLLFSVLSSMGTLILICLTLRVRQIADGSIHT